jgi:DNA-directed RNA polymerase subunit RPC12/RpoP
MIKKLVKCDSCGVTLEVPQRKEEPYRDIHCPNCNHQLHVEFKETVRQIAETIYGGQPGRVSRAGSHADGETVLAAPKAAISGKLKVGLQQYPLRMGNNVVGRKAASSQANVQIVTDDKYMSRQHSLIKVSKVADGSLKALISNYQNKHTTYVNGMELLAGDEVQLLNGALIKMGITTIKYIEE